MSKNVTDLAEAYAKLLASIDVTPKSDDRLVQNLDEVEKHLRVDNKPLVLPTKKAVSNYTEDVVIFHPLSENNLLGESPVLQELRILVMDKLNDLTMRVIEAVLTIAIDDNIIKELTSNQVKLMRAASNADANALKNWQSIMRRVEPRSPNSRLLTVFLKRGATLNDTKYQRAAIVNFNLYNELDENNPKILGAKVRKSDVKLYGAIFESLFPEIDDNDYYSAGSNSPLAPYFDALVHAYHNVLVALNSFTWTMRKHIQEAKGVNLHVKDDFMDDLKNLVEYRDTLPVMPLNDGDRQPRRQEEEPQQPQQQQQASPPPPPPPVQQPTQAPVSPFHQQPAQQPVQQPQYQQAQPVQQPQYQQPQSQQGNTSLPSLNAQLSGVPLAGNQMPMQQPYSQPYQGQPAYQSNPFVFGGVPQPNPYMPPQYQQQPVQPQNPFVAPQYGQQPMYNPQPQPQGYYQQPMQPQQPWPAMPVNWGR